MKRGRDDTWVEVDELLAALKMDEKKANANRPGAMIPPLIKTAEINVRLAKINDVSTGRVAHLTWWLLVLTIGLLFLTIGLGAIAWVQTKALLQQSGQANAQGVHASQQDKNSPHANQTPSTDEQLPVTNAHLKHGPSSNR